MTQADRLRILMPSIVDPATDRGGAGTVTRAIASLLRQPPLAAQVHVVPHRPGGRDHRLRQALALGRSLVTALPAKVAFTCSRRFRSAVRRALQEQRPDLVIIDGSDLLWLLAELPPAVPRILLAHNIEHEVFRSQIDSLGRIWAPLRRALLRDCQRLMTYELAGLRRMRHLIFVSSHDAAYAQSHCPGVHAMTMPPVFDYAPAGRRPGDGELLRIGFLGNLGWWPNRHGLRWFLRDVLPHAGPHIQLHLFGSGSRNAARRHPRIIRHGFVADVRDAFAASSLMICPLFSGGGAKVKLAEALYNGVPVLATPFAARGLPVTPGCGLRLLDGAANWIAFLRSPAAREFARTPPPPDTAARFSAGAHRERVQALVREAALQRGH